MKCLYSVPEGASGRVREACEEYAQALREWSKGASSAADRLGDFVESASRGRLCIDDDDWGVLRAQIRAAGADVPLAEIFWATNDSLRIADAIESLGPAATARGTSVQAWLRAEVEAGRSIVALTK